MFVLLFFGIVGFAIGRVITLCISSFFHQRNYLNEACANTMIILGSGGHTTEMLEIVKKLNKDRYVPRFYVVSEGDQNSVDKLLSIENDRDDYKIYVITRSRKVHQSYFSSIFTTLKSFIDCIPLLHHSRPNLILCNGPGICVPVCIVAYLLKVFYINTACRIVFIESYCRVKTLSLSGWILLYLTDLFIVQWPELAKKVSRKVMYFGRLT
ncbi:UDP-N-acetylglucosamine transferase subunit ALG14 [Chironomus tepperi]|uniref:UDP-N-acetylglucosamine transferase subunit ALG14 n=1 Tax=Chironomus tepperi TaxID=113505 RepID=UPI00391F8D99